MGEFDLNLSTRPFPAYKLKTLLLTVALFVLIGITAWQAYGFIVYSSLAAQIRGDARKATVDATALDRRLAEMESRLNQPEAMAKLNEIGFLNDIINRKSFSWTRLFATLEQLTPDSVHLVSLIPGFVPETGILLQINVRGRTMSDIKQFIEALQASAVFDTVRVHFEAKTENNANAATDLDIALTVPYHPEREGQ